ncbi:MAG: lysophospholipid acyltransferase family protein [Calditrichaceae bacterium]
MIKARHNIWADKIFEKYLNRLFKNHFYSINVLSEYPVVKTDLPLIIIPNHSTWWDGFLIYHLNKRIFGRRMFVMMEEKQLKKFPFFSRLGAFGVNAKSVKSVLKSLKYAGHVLKNAENMLCIFPQGVLERWHKRPIEYKRGIEKIIENIEGDSVLLPLAIRAEFTGEQRPEIFLNFGESLLVNKTNFPGIQILESQHEQLLDQLADKVRNGDEGEKIFSGKKSLSDR